MSSHHSNWRLIRMHAIYENSYADLFAACRVSQAVKDDEVFYTFFLDLRFVFFHSLAIRLCFVLMSFSRHGKINSVTAAPAHPINTPNERLMVANGTEQIPTINQLIIIRSNSVARFCLRKPHTLQMHTRLTLDNMMATYECRLQMPARMNFNPANEAQTEVYACILRPRVLVEIMVGCLFNKD